MSGKTLAVREPTTPVQLTTEQLKYIQGTEFIPKQYRNNLPAMMACIATGRELGLGDLESLRLIDVVDGRPSLRAELMVKLVRRAGHSISGSASATQAKAVGKRGDTGDEMTVTWTADMAKRADLARKQNYQRYPEAMLWARAVSQLCRMLFPDCLSGVSYVPEEAEWIVEEEELSEATSLPALEAQDYADGIDEAADDPGPEDPSLFGSMVPESARRQEPGS